jgi:hypothetical protein
MAHTNLSHRRTHNLLLISKLLSQRDGASPFTLVLDSLEQPANSLIGEYIKRAKVRQFHFLECRIKESLGEPIATNLAKEWNVELNFEADSRLIELPPLIDIKMRDHLLIIRDVADTRRRQHFRSLP